MKETYVVDLYGGAMQCSLPKGMLDVSKLRQVPDTQEVFVSANKDESIIFDLLEYVNLPDMEAVRMHIEQIAECNDAVASEILSCVHLEDACVPHLPHIPKYIAYCRQSVSKFGEAKERANEVHMAVAVIRLETHATDFVITFNVPVNVHTDSSSHDLDVAGQSEKSLAKEDIMAVLKSLCISDYGLFG